MSGTGKSEATNFLKDQFNFDLFYFGGIVLNEVKKRGLEINNENEKMVREDLRRQHGNGVLAKIASETIAKPIRPFSWTAFIALRNTKY